MTEKTFLDTAVLVFAHDAASPQKRERAWAILKDERQRMVLSPQVLAEFYAIVTGRLPVTLPEKDAEAAVRELTVFAELIVPDRTLLLEALALARRDQLSVWDALVVQCALTGRCTRVLTGDIQHGRRFGNLTIENPFNDLA